MSIDRSLFGRDHVERYVETDGEVGYMSAQPEVQLQVKGDRFRAGGRTAEGEERERLWAAMNEIWPHYDEYQTKTTRQIPVVVLDRL